MNLEWRERVSLRMPNLDYATADTARVCEELYGRDIQTY